MKLRLLLFIIITLGLYIRLLQVDVLNNFILSDLGRDILVAKHISSGKTDTIFIRPLSTWNTIPTTPVYFWMVSILYLLSRSAQGVVFSGCIIGAFVVVISFYIGKKAKGIALGLLYSFLFSFTYIFVYYSRTLNPFSFVILLVSLGFAAYISSTKTAQIPSIIWLFTSIFFIFTSVCIHFSTIMIVPSFMVLWLLQGLKLNTHKNRGVPLFATLIFILWATTTFTFLSYFGGVGFALPEALGYGFQLSGIYGNISTILESLFSQNPLFLILFVPGIIYGYIKRKDSYFKSLFILNCSLIFYFFVPFLPKRPFRSEYLTPIYILGTFLIGGYIHSLFLMKNVRVIVVLICITAVIVITNIRRIYRYQVKISTYTLEDSKIIAKLILHSDLYIGKKGFRIILPFYGFAHIPNISEYFSVGIWYSLETLTNKQLVTVVDTYTSITGNNTTYWNPHNNNILICIDNPANRIFTLSKCLLDYAHYFKKDKKSLRFVGEEGGFSVYEEYQLPQ